MQLPVGWIKTKLGDVCTKVEYGSSAKSKPEGEIPVLRMGNIKNGVIDWNDLVYTTDQEEIDKYLLKHNDILFNRTNSAEHVGKTAIYKSERPAIFAGYLIRVHRKEDLIDADFLNYYLNSNTVREYGKSVMSRSVNQANINGTKLKDYPMLLPPLPEQKRIVAILDEAFEGIDRAIANTEKNLANSREVFESYLNAIFTQKRDGWGEKKLEDICKEITVGHVGSMASKYRDSGIPFLRSQNKNILPFRIKLDNVVFIDNEFHSALKKSQLKPGDLAIVRTGYPGTAAVIPEELGIVNCSDLVIVKPDENINPHYLCLFFNSIFGKTLVGSRLVGAAQKHFNITTAKKVLIPFPYLTEQNRLVTKMDELASETQRLEAIYRQKLAALNELKQSILQKAFTGELTADTPKTAKEEIAA
jgi:type I restriction enzyme S subunit